ncbi:MAG: alpha/beta fold hydrolase, partial [Bdellovibrionales bacterium]|nr:alpha/beta fold hydrolase [Bdellovibrionales bacterium]
MSSTEFQRPLVLLSGWGHGPAAMEPLARSLRSRGRDVRLLLDVHGFCNVDGSVSALQPPHGSILVGWSLGAFVALTTAIRFPDAVDGLVLISGFPRFTATGDFPCGVPPAQLRLLRRGVAASGPASLAAFFEDVAGCRGADDDSRAGEHSLAEAEAIGTEALLRGLAVLDCGDLREDIARVTCAVAAFHGGGDRVVSPAVLEWWAHALPRSTRILFPQG